MTSRAERLSEALERVHRSLAAAELGWYRRGHLDVDWIAGARHLVSPEGTDQSQEALRERTWTRAEQAAFVAQRAELAFAAELATGLPLIRNFASEPLALPFGREELGPLVRGLWSEGSLEEREYRGNALGQTTSAFAPRLFELRSRALAARERALRELHLPEEAVALPAHPGLPPATAAEENPTEAAPPDALELARTLLENTEDAMRELTRWLVRPCPVSGTIPWHVLLRALRAPELDGLARPARRLARVAQGLRALGFERDLDARVRAERGAAMFDPRARVVRVGVPGDIRIAQTTLDFGVMSDVYAAHGVGTALALALASPALPLLVRRSRPPGVAEAIGSLAMQLRADRGYLRLVDGVDAMWTERLARQAGILVLLELRLLAALVRSEREHARTDAERVQQLTAALEGALGAQLPVGLAVLASWTTTPGSGAFEAALSGLAAHAGLRERLDSDWYRNPRASEVVRGAAARGGALAFSELLDELGVSVATGLSRSLELLG